ncbi:MAG: glycosyltransferase [Chitinispirillales bacterium]|jgi:glycosyltransferase involved in cell wall biosynthesis|nr:glycosyltransferase [Chitinispirillales bacterium]
MEPLISVIVPTYNGEKYIGRCIESIQNQTYKNLEIIVVNDGSTDKTNTILDQYANRDYRITVCNQENGGVSRARNTGIAMAKGHFIGFVDDDDAIEKDMYELLIKNILEYSADISQCGCKEICAKKINYHCSTEDIVLQNNKLATITLLAGKRKTEFNSMCNKIYKSELFKNFKLNEAVTIAEDFIANYYLFSKSEKFVFIKNAGYNYYKRENSATTAGINFESLKQLFLAYSEIINSIDPESEIYMAALDQYLNLLFGLLKQKECAPIDEYKIFQEKLIYEFRKHKNEIYRISFNSCIREIFGILKLNKREINNKCKIFQKELILELKENIKKIIKTKGLKTKYKIDTIGVSFIPFYLSARYYGTHCKNKRKFKK